MLDELESNAEQLDGFAATLATILEEFGLTCEEEGSLKNVVEEEEEAPREEGAETGERAAEPSA
jgi:hypothetical protein